MVHSFACVLGSFIDDDWNIIKRVVDFKVLEDKEHGGLYGGKAFVESCCGIGGFNKMSPNVSASARRQILLTSLHCMTVTTDNASVDDTIVGFAARALLAKYGIPANPNLHVRCLCHVVNLVVQAILHELCEAEDPDEMDYFEVIGKQNPVHLDPQEDAEQKEMDREEFDDTTKKAADTSETIDIADEELASACNGPVSKVRPSSCIFRDLLTLSSCGISQPKSSRLPNAAFAFVAVLSIDMAREIDGHGSKSFGTYGRGGTTPLQ